jgi:4-amino-4-deoxy-L-arabinose transferase-like glycosyltransferase
VPRTASREPFASREVGAVAVIVGLVLLALSGRYGYHRDELYFLQCGHHLAWGYPDQPPMVPLLARAMDALAANSLVVLRLPSDVAAAIVVFVAGLMARDLRARRGGQVIAAVATALCGFVLATGHLLSTSTFSLLGWTLVTALLVRVLTGCAGARVWLALGLAAGLTAQANVLDLALVAGFGVAVVMVGPRSLFRQVGPYAAVGITLAISAPYLIWQARNGFPQVEIAHSIADGGSGSSQSRWLFLPFQILQVGPWLAPIWIVGLVRLWKEPRLRSLSATYGVLAVVFLIGGGKPYYLSGLYPLLFAAGAQPLLDWGRARARPARWVTPALLVLSTPGLIFVLPLLPVRDAGIAIAVNSDVGETIGWPSYVDQIAAAYAGLPAGTEILTHNYGEAGAVDRFGPEHDLPAAFSGHNAFATWGPPPGSAPVLAVGMPAARLALICTHLRDVGALRETDGVDNDENGASLTFCEAPVEPWAVLWPRLTRLG